MSTTNLNDEGRQWYVVNTYSGHENKVRENILKRVESMGIQDCLFNIVIPTHVETVLKEEKVVGEDGKKTKVQKKVNVTTNKFPGYVLVEMIMTDEAWYVVRNTPGVTGFIGSSGKGAKPFPVSGSEIESVLKRVGLNENSSTSEYKIGDTIRIINGPFAEQISAIEALDEEKGLVTIKTVIFGREQELQVSVNDIEKY